MVKTEKNIPIVSTADPMGKSDSSPTQENMDIWRVISYEFGQMHSTANYPLKSWFPFGNKRRQVLKNSILESFLIHIRSVLEFLYSKSSMQTNKAADYLEQPNDWEDDRDDLFSTEFAGEERATIDPDNGTSGNPKYINFYKNISQDMIHINEKRLQRLTEKKNWEMKKLMFHTINIFRAYITLIRSSDGTQIIDSPHFKKLVALLDHIESSS